MSIATVSLVHNGKAKEKRISDALAERVLAYVRESHRVTQLQLMPQLVVRQSFLKPTAAKRPKVPQASF